MSDFKADCLRRADETLQNMSAGVIGDKILTTEFKDKFLETVAESIAFSGAQTPQDASNAIVEGFERELTLRNVPTNIHAALRRNFILTYMSEK